MVCRNAYVLASRLWSFLFCVRGGLELARGVLACRLADVLCPCGLAVSTTPCEPVAAGVDTGNLNDIPLSAVTFKGSETMPSSTPKHKLGRNDVVF